MALQLNGLIPKVNVSKNIEDDSAVARVTHKVLIVNSVALTFLTSIQLILISYYCMQ